MTKLLNSMVDWPGRWSLCFSALVVVGVIGTASNSRAEENLEISLKATRGIFQDCAKADFTGCGASSSRPANIAGQVIYNSAGAHVTGRMLDLDEPIDIVCQADWKKTSITLAGDKAVAECRYLADMDAQKLRLEINYTLGAAARSGVIRQVLTFSIDVQSCIVGVKDATVKPPVAVQYVANCVAK